MTEHVVVLHGLALNSWWMSGMARALKAAGYEVHNISYPSRKKNFKRIVDEDVKPLIDSLPPGKIHFVAHSMGGLLVRLYAKEYGAARVGRVVMLGTPNHGSQAADALRDVGLFKWFFGETGTGLGTAEKDLAATLGPVPFECGVIAGDNHWFHFPVSALAKIPGPSDGIVSVESTKVEGMKDHIVLWLDHSMMVWDSSAAAHAVAFLRAGRFR